MKHSEDLRQMLRQIDRKSYPAYKSLTGTYQFDHYCLSIQHVQGDPFASPSRISISVSQNDAGFPPEYRNCRHRKTALEDYLVRCFGKQIQRFQFQAKGSGKSGLLSVSRPGQEILERTACTCTAENITLRFEVGFPAHGRTICSGELEKILFQYLPHCVNHTCFFSALSQKELQDVIFLADDQQEIRNLLPKLNLIAFVANGSILPRESGLSDRPLSQAVPFVSPESLTVTLQLPHRGTTRGLGIPKGITLIAGGGYHGKSTLLQALERGVYNHIAGDGRELVITDHTALKLRAEDGRKISGTDISLFINDLPNQKDTHCFSTLDASGSTSQAANIIEGLESGSHILLIDEDTSATNFMIRDELMQQIISRAKEPITPFLERARDLYENADISTVLVVGSSGSYFHIADTVLQMDCYRPLDITQKVQEICSSHPVPSLHAPGFQLPSRHRCLNFKVPEPSRKKTPPLKTQRTSELPKIKLAGKTAFSLNKETLDLRYLEQLTDSEQTAALAYLLRYILIHYKNSKKTLVEIVDEIEFQTQKRGLEFLFQSSDVPSGLAVPRRQELFACINRW